MERIYFSLCSTDSRNIIKMKFWVTQVSLCLGLNEGYCGDFGPFVYFWPISKGQVHTIFDSVSIVSFCVINFRYILSHSVIESFL